MSKFSAYVSQQRGHHLGISAISVPQSSASIMQRASYTASFKIKAVEHAEKHGIREAGRTFDVNECNIRLWKKNKETLSNKNRTCRDRGRRAAHPELEDKLVEYVRERRESGSAVTTVQIRLYALKVMREIDPSSQFKASPKWCYNFMNRHDISIRRRTSIAQRLPDDFENKLVEYQRYIIQLRKTRQYANDMIANADQTPLTFDIPFNHTLDFKGRKSIVLKTTGNEKNRFTVMLGPTATARRCRPT